MNSFVERINYYKYDLKDCSGRSKEIDKNNNFGYKTFDNLADRL